MTEWKEVEDRQMFKLCNELVLFVFEDNGLWWYEIMSDWHDEQIISQFHAPTEIKAKELGLKMALHLASKTLSSALKGLEELND
jgi:hypothetical protein